MHDIKAIRDNPEAFDKALTRRGLAPQAAELLKHDEARRTHLQKLQDAQSRRNSLSKEIGDAMKSGDKARAETLKAEVASLKDFIGSGEEDERKLTQALNDALAVIPNLPLDEVPDGADEKSNVEVRRWGEPRKFDFAPREHFDIGEWLGLMDFEVAAKMSGARFVVLKGQLARLERALAQFMLDLHTGEHGFNEVSPPLLVRENALFGANQMPKFENDLFWATHTEGLFGGDGDLATNFKTNRMGLIPTSEVSLANLVREATLEAAHLPMRLTAHTPCFRAEAGAAGRDTRGMIRQHQFYKVEMVSITAAETSLEELERMTGCAEEVLKRLGLPYRTVVLCAGDMGFGARKTYDIEVWLPGQGAYREISSCSVCGEFQARRMNARYKPEGAKQAQYVHTLNGSGVAVGRALIAVLENYQNADGSVTIPEVLRPYMGGREIITRP
ncbi:MAG: serine--tRNA ligase [Rhizobiales bacterium]|nr:serine--tRNA ligase [Hyphomicrobiales bacterium]